MEDYNRKGCCSLEKIIDRYKGQPVEILTSDGVRYCGIVLMVCEEAVEIIDKCSRVIFIPFRHIDAIVEPKMKLTPFCARVDCECHKDDCECERDNDHRRDYD
ncbi:MAG: hypothetical protein FWE98_06360 [Oscillospiraceae bacterium]|nr:hypothetical protein [Oscillospiraceae bacterium]